jgi:hypothetical protein
VHARRRAMSISAGGACIFFVVNENLYSEIAEEVRKASLESR